MLTISRVDAVPEALPASARRAAQMATDAYPEHVTLLVGRRGGIVGCWVVPCAQDPEGLHARRPSRVLPYAAPVLLDEHPQQRRDVMGAMLAELSAAVCSIELPLAPGFTATTVCRSLGMAVEWRHTHILDLQRPWRERYTVTVAQHLRAARSQVQVQPSAVEAFRFDRALVGHSPRDRQARQDFAAKAATEGEVLCLSALHSGVTCGQILMLTAGRTAVLMHAWFDRAGPRGVPSCLIDEAADAARQRGLDQLDLEGSVLPGVDYFMSGFGGETVPIPHLYWHRDRARLSELLMTGVMAGSDNVSERAPSFRET